MRVRKILFFVFLAITIAIDATLIIESIMDGSSSGNQSLGFTKWLVDIITFLDPTNILKEHVNEVHAVVRKLVGHFLFFGLSGIFSMLTLLFGEIKLKRIYVILIGLGKGLFLASLTELIQYFVPGRAGQLTDILIDFGGYILFFLLTYLIYYLIERHHNKKLKES